MSTEMTDDQFDQMFKDCMRLFTLEWNFLLQFRDDLYVPIAPEIEKFSSTLVMDRFLFPKTIIFFKNLTKLHFGWSPDNLVCKYSAKAISIVYQTFELFKQFVLDFPNITPEELNQKQSPNKIKLMRYLIAELSKFINIRDQSKPESKRSLLLISDIVNPVADFLGFDCLMNICDYVYNGSWVPCIFEHCKYNTKIFITEKLDTEFPNIRLQFLDKPLKTQEELYERLLPKLCELPEHCRNASFLKYACQVLVDPVLSPNSSKVDDSCGIAYFCKTITNETIIVDKKWINPYDYRLKFYGVKTLLPRLPNRDGELYKYSSEASDNDLINSIIEF